tara:strand:- start:398 stop:634 length:237 start_codon:yes stop_codon:yes gene_type:complete
VNKDLVEMNNPQTLNKLKPLVNNNRQWQALNDYIDGVIDTQRKALEQSDDNVMMYRSQGAIAALRRLKTLREEVNGTE